MIEQEEKNVQPTPEVPIIIIEREEETEGKILPPTPQRSSRFKKLVFILALVFCCVCVVVGYKVWAHYNLFSLPISVTPAENIEKLAAPATNEPASVVMTTDSILGVVFDMFALHGVEGSIEFQEPDTADASVYLYCRASDFTAEGKYLGSLISKGQEYADDASRWGYMAMAGGNNVIGISDDESVRDYVKEQGGSFFRQFVLVSDGQLPPQFYLHGKVERCAIGRMGDRLYFISSHHKESMWSFADALREYGFIDAIYITGGRDYSFYRDAKGTRHDIHDPKYYPHKKWAGILPWLVFRKK